MFNHYTALLIIMLHFTPVFGELLQSNSVHKTPAAERPLNDLWCYKCNTMDGNDRCIDLLGNFSQHYHKCKDDKRQCMVKRFSYTVSTENSTSLQKMWSLERNCTKHCEPGCIIIGERTKLYACTSCCSSSFCNNGTGKASSKFSNDHTIAITLVSVLVGSFTVKRNHNSNCVVSWVCLVFCIIPLIFIRFSQDPSRKLF